MRLLTTLALAIPLHAIAQERPNIILFMVDDMGWQDTSLAFHTERSIYNDRYETPNMERLAQQGVMMTQAYASPISSPSRCSLMSGSNAARHGVTNWTLRKNQSTDDPDSLCTVPQWNVNGISPVSGIERTYPITSFVELLRQSGYHTIHVGKAHWGAKDTPGEDPLNWGFVRNVAGHAAGGPATYLSERNYGHDDSGKPLSHNAIPDLREYWQSGTFLTEALTQRAICELAAAPADQPFYLYMSHYAIHVPIERDMRFYPKYIAKGLSEKEAAYASLIEGMDKSLGDIMDYLEKSGKARNTILIFMSDNGGYATGSYWRDEPLYTQNAPLRCGKGSLYEGGIREPMIVSWPGTVKPGTRCDKYLLIEDFFPTLLEMGRVKQYAVPQTIDGISFVPLLTGKKDISRNRPLIWNFPNVWDNSGPGISLNCAIRLGKWKMIYSYKTGRKELYNLTTDIGESNDLSARYPKVVKKLSRRLSAYLRSVNAQRPTFTATGRPCPFPDER